MKRVVITGIGVISPVGVGREKFWSALCEGRSGISRIEEFDTSNLKTTIAGICREFRPADFFDERELSRLDRVSQMAIAATDLALEEAGLAEAQLANYDTGVILGTGFGGQASIEDFCGAFYLNDRSRRSAVAIPKSMYNASASSIAIRFKTRGPNITVTTACSSGANAIGQAAHLIRYGQAERMIAGGADAPVTQVVMDAWKDMRVLSTKNEAPERACKPFSANRDGFVLAEAAGIVILESLESALGRGARIYADVAGEQAEDAVEHDGEGVFPREMQRLRWRPVGQRGRVEAVLAQVEDKIGDPVASEPEQVALEVLGGRAPAGAAEALDHRTAVRELP